MPILITQRLRLRPFQLSDAKDVQRLAGDPKVAATTATIPHPYLDGIAESWISQHADWFDRGVGAQFAIELSQTRELIGCISFVSISKNDFKAELGYWIGFPYWNNGYCSEAAAEIVRFGFENLALNKIAARYLATNLASGRVLSSAGFVQEGHLRQEIQKNGQFRDLVLCGLTRDEWAKTKA